MGAFTDEGSIFWLQAVEEEGFRCLEALDSLDAWVGIRDDGEVGARRGEGESRTESKESCPGGVLKAWYGGGSKSAHWRGHGICECLACQCVSGDAYRESEGAILG